MNLFKKKVYIAGAVKGLPFDEVEAKFNAVKVRLEALGYHVINPIERIRAHNTAISHYGYDQLSDENEADRIEIIKLCFHYINECQLIFFMPCSKNSEGAGKERIYADMIKVKELVLD